MSPSPDALDVLTRDHREVERMIAAYEESTDPGQRRALMDRLIVELVRHSVAEEEHLYPAVRAALPDGDTVVDAGLRKQAEAERVMNALDGADAGAVEFERGMARLTARIREHVAEEENDVFPRLRAALPVEERSRLGERIEQAKKTAPTHPHPHTPDKPPFSTLVTPGAALTDRVRDWLTGRSR